MSKRIITIVGTRPQFVKASVVSLAIKKLPDIEEILLHTGQHFDENMSEVFFKELGIPKPAIKLDINGGNHGQMTGRMLECIEEMLIAEKPDRVMIYGDTNSTLAGALAASKLHIPVAHVEAGLRSFDRQMPEEINRIIADHVSDILFCPTDIAVENLRNEGLASRAETHIINVGDVMLDSAQIFSKQAQPPSTLNEPPKNFVLATFHRAENTDNIAHLNAIVSALNIIHSDIPVVLPLHPRTRAAISQANLELDAYVIDPVSYFEMLWLLQRCALVVTDSGGLQKEAFFHKKPCVTLRDSTEWVELVQADVNILVGADENRIIQEIRSRLGKPISINLEMYGSGHASARIANLLAEY